MGGIILSARAPNPDTPYSIGDLLMGGLVPRLDTLRGTRQFPLAIRGPGVPISGGPNIARTPDLILIKPARPTDSRVSVLVEANVRKILVGAQALH